MASFRWWAGSVASLLLAVGIGGLVWGVVVEPRMLQKRCIRAELPGLPHAWHGQRLALLADLQLGAPLANTGTVRRAVRQAIEAQPGVVLLAGDYVYDAADKLPEVLEELVDLLRPLGESALPTFAVLGNHDFAPESTSAPRRQQAIANEVVTALERIGIRVLRNEALPIPAPGQAPQNDFYVVGLGERSRGQDDAQQAFANVPARAARVVLAHDPAVFKDVPAGWAPLALAGHTHGGQIRVPGTRDLGPARWRMPWPEYVDGWIDGLARRGNRVYVNRGIGFSHLPMRVGAPPELTLITLEPMRDKVPAARV